MKRPLIFFLTLSSSLFFTIALAGSCSSEDPEASQRRPVTEIKPDSGAEGDAEAGAVEVDATALMVDVYVMDPIRDVKDAPQAVQVLITIYDTEIREGEVGKFNGSTPPVKAFSAALIEEVKAEKERLKELAASKRIAPSSSLLNDRLRFESQASQSHLNSIFKDMFDTMYMTRRIDTSSGLIRMIDDQLKPVLTDEDFQQELATTRAEAEKRLDRAQTVKSGLLNGSSSQGLFEEGAFDPKPLPEPDPLPGATQPAATPAATQPAATQSAATPPAATQPAGDGGGAAP